MSFDLCSFAPAERQNKIWRYSKKMKKVVYSIKKVRGNSDDKISGLGFLNEEGKKNKRRSRRNEETRSQNSIKMANRSIYDKTRCYYVH